MVPPSFIQRPQTQTVKEGKPVRFTIRVAGQPPPEITWYKDGSKITSSPDFELVQEDDIHSLCIPEVFYEDAGQYTVEAKNPAGQTQCTANLRIEGRHLNISGLQQRRDQCYLSELPCVSTL